MFFCQEGAAYCVFSENGTYISAVRIEPFEDGYLLSALETKPDSRRRGYGKRLIEGLILECTEKRKLPIYSHVKNKNIASINLHLQCGFRVYKDSARYLDGSVRTDSKTLVYKK
jgi:GNAT superfamily N-acetyltransferase